MYKKILYIVTFVIGIINAQGGQDVLTPMKAYRRTPYVLDAAISNNPSMKYFRYAFNNDIAQAAFHPVLLRVIANLFDKRTSLFPLTTQYSPSWAFDNKIKELGGTRNVSYKNMIRSVSSGTLSLRQLCEIVLYYHKSLIVLEVPSPPQTPAPAPVPQSVPQSAQAPAAVPPPPPPSKPIAPAQQAPMPALLSDTTSTSPSTSSSQSSPFFQMIANQLTGSPPSASQPPSNNLDVFFNCLVWAPRFRPIIPRGLILKIEVTFVSPKLHYMGVIRNCQSTDTSPILQRPSSRTSMFLSPSETYARAGHLDARRETTVIQGMDNTVTNRNIVHVYIDPNTGRVISNDERFNEEDERLRNAENQNAVGEEEQMVEDEGELENVVATLTRMQQFSDALREFADTITGEEEHSAINELSNLLQNQESPEEAVEVEAPIILVENAPVALNRVDSGALQVAASTPFIMSSIASPMNNRSTPTDLVQAASRTVDSGEVTNESRPPHTADLQSAIIDVLNRNIEEEISQSLVDRRNETAERWRRLISRRRTMFESMVQQEVQFWHSVEERLACLNVSDAPLIDNFEHVGRVSFLQNSELITEYVGR